MPDIENIQEENFEDKNIASENMNGNILPHQPIEQSSLPALTAGDTESLAESGGQISNRPLDIPKSEIENMEVHRHPHVKKKSFKEYFFQG